MIAARGEALPGVHVGAAHIGGLDAVEARAAVDRHYGDVLAQPIDLVVDGATWTPTAGELGFAVAGEIDRDARDARIEQLATYSKLVPSRDGRTVDRAALATDISRAIVSDERGIVVLIVTAEAGVTPEDMMRERGITDVVAVGDSVYVGSGSRRAHNVEQAANVIDGTLVEPGGEISFNDAVGSLFSGEYREAGSYIDGPSGTSLAGGVCQVSTTVYRAALTGGFPIVEWRPHSYRSPFYGLGGWEPGWDGSIVQDGNDPTASTDFRFVNPTGSWLVIRATVTADDTLTVEMHGAPTGYEVWFDEPEVETIAWATDAVRISVDAELSPGTILPDQPKMDGLEVTVVRYVAVDGDVISVDTFVTT